MLSKVITKIREEARGEITVEYGLIIALIAIISIGILFFTNGSGGDNYDISNDSLKNSQY